VRSFRNQCCAACHRQHALDAVTKLAREVVAERVAHGEASPEIMLLSFDAA